MKKSNIAVTTAVSGLLALAGVALAPSVAHAADKEKCYGVVKAGKNDCATKTSSCAGTSKTDGQKDAFVMVPKGLCDRLAGSSKEAK
ncbi:membrane protein [Photobacterium aquae]|uniref:Membrane protein n=1 Tax=Photobacterium aquae TaxID=1195763 RepID=A0A0J1H7W5_9GAMM|nr:DUF2282 domain-containing protein [Photobacterium aquae]KLV07809.1 membrane protein [Photobacterium aquae]